MEGEALWLRAGMFTFWLGDCWFNLLSWNQYPLGEFSYKFTQSLAISGLNK